MCSNLKVVTYAWVVAQIKVGMWLFRAALIVAVSGFLQHTVFVSALAKPADVLGSVVSVLPEWANPRSRASEPQGSGVVILDGSKIVTARHVINNALSIRVKTYDGRILPAKIIGQDRLTDLAVLSIEEKLLPLSFGREAKLGEPVCAIGNAFGLGLSMTCGVVSAVHKAGVGFNPIEDFVQTDAAVNPGASGGALISGDGALLGILSAIFTKQSDANIGVNFAVSSQLAERTSKVLAENKSIVWQFSGAKLNPALAPDEAGVLGAVVLNVAAGSPADKAGLQTGDIILTAGARRIRIPADFTSAFVSSNPGMKLDLKIIRKNSEIALEILVPE